MARYYRRRRYSRAIAPKRKYSFEHVNFVHTEAIQNASYDKLFNLVPATNVNGMRKCKNFTLNLVTATNTPIYFALIYVPEGITPNQLNIALNQAPEDPPYQYNSSVSLYEPNQNVIMSGIIPANNTARSTFSTRMARNLNSGDAIFLVVKSATTLTAQIEMAGELSYCISYS